MRGALAGLVLVLAALSAGCAQPPLPEDHFYRLIVDKPETAASGPLLKGALEVDRFAADGLIASRPIVYSLAGRPREVLEYHYHFWAEPPTRMLGDQLVEYLRAAGVARTVVTPEFRVQADYVIVAKIKRLEMIVGAPPRAAVELELGLRKTADDKLLFLGVYGVETEAESATVAAAVEAINKVLGQIYAKFVADISEIPGI